MKLLSLLSVAVVTAPPSPTKPPYITAEELTSRADFIGIVHVDSVYVATFGLMMARASVIDQYAGRQRPSLELVISPLTQESDHAPTKGQTLLLFSDHLNKWQVEHATGLPNIPESGLNCIAHWASGQFAVKTVKLAGGGVKSVIMGNRRDSRYIFAGLTQWPSKLSTTTIIDLPAIKDFVQQIKRKR